MMRPNMALEIDRVAVNTAGLGCLNVYDDCDYWIGAATQLHVR